MARLRRILRWAGKALLWTTGVTLVLILTVILVLISPWGNEQIRAQVESAAQPSFPGGSLVIGGLDTNLFGSIALENVAIRDRQGKTLIGFERLELGWELGGLIHEKLVVDTLRLERPVVDLTVLEDGTLDLQKVLGPPKPDEPSEPWTGLPIDLQVPSAQILDGVVLVGGNTTHTKIDGLGLDLGVALQGPTVHVDHLELKVPVKAPIVLDVSTQGEVIFTGADVVIPELAVYLGETILKLEGRTDAVQSVPILDLGVSLEPLAPSTLEAVVGEPVLAQPVTYAARLTGPLADLRLESTLSSEGLGALGLDVSLGLESDPLSWDVTLAPESFQVDKLALAVPVPVTLDGSYGLKGTGVEWPAGIEAAIKIDGGEQVLGGEAVAGLVLDASLSGGRLDIAKLSARHSVASVDLGGWADLIRSRASIDLRAQIPNAGALSTYGVTGMGGRAGFKGHVDASWAPDVDVVVDGDLTLANFLASGTRIREGAGPIRVEVHGDDVEGSGSLHLQGIAASGAQIRSVKVSFEGGQTAKGDVRVDAGLEVDHVVMADRLFEMDRLAGTLRARIPARGDLMAKADMDVQTFRLNKGAYTVDGGPIAFEAKGDDVWANLDLRRGGAPFLVGRIEGNLDTGQWGIKGFQVAVKAKDGLVAQQDISFTLGKDGAEKVLLSIGNPGGRGHIRLEGRATGNDPDLHLQMKKVNLSYVVEMIHELMGVGPGGKNLPGKGSPDQPIVEEEDDFAPVFPGDKPAPEPAPKPDPKVARVEQRSSESLPMLAGLASMDVRLRKEGGAFVVNGWVELDDLVVPGQVDGADLRVRLDLGQDQAKVKLRVATGDDLLLVSEGQVPISQSQGRVELSCGGKMDLRSIVPALKLKQLAKHVPAVSGVQGRVSMDLRVRGDACNPDIDLVAASDVPIGSQGERARVDLELQRIGDKLVLRTSVEEDQRRMVVVNSEMKTHLAKVIRALRGGKEDVKVDDPATWLESFDASVVLEAVPLEEVARLTDITHPIRGILGGGLNIRGTVDKPEIRGGLVVVDGRIGEVDLKRGTVEISPSGEGYKLGTDLAFQGGGALGLHGYLPLNLGTMDLKQPGLDLVITGSGVPLALAAGPGGISDADGLLALEGKVTGSLQSPIPALGVRTEGAAFTLGSMGLRYEPVSLDIGFTPERLDIRKFDIGARQLWALKPRDGVLRVRGAVDLDDGELTNVNLTAQMEDFWLSSIRLATLAVSGDLSIKGAYPDLKVRGALQADEARFVVGEADLADTSGLEIDSSITIHREKVEVVQVIKEEESPSVIDNFDVALDVDLKQKVALKADIPLSSDFGKQFSQLAAFTMDMGLDGLLKITSKKGQLEVAGEVLPLRGFLEVLGKRFDLQEGRIIFTGANYASPALDLSASHQVGQYGSVDIKITGDVDQSVIDFSSSDYPDQTDVMSMLLFGKPTSAMSETEGESGSSLLSAALSTVGGQAARSSGAAFLQNVSVDPGSGAVKVGFPLSDKVYLAIERLQPESESDNTTQASIEWILARRTYAELITGDQGKSSGDLYWRWRF
jgi:autotransporter translocation and assembly factor TamB